MSFENVKFVNKENLTLVGKLYKGTTPKGVVLCHGFTGSKNMFFFPQLCEKLQAWGFWVLAFDFSGNGDSEGKFEERTYTHYLGDVECALDFMKEKVETVVLMGYSMGGAVSFLQSEHELVSSLVLIAPALMKGSTLISQKAKEQGKIFFKDCKGREKWLPNSYFEDRARYDFGEHTQKVSKPVHILLGEKDVIISKTACKNVLDTLSGEKSYTELTGEDHTFHGSVSSLFEESLKKALK